MAHIATRAVHAGQLPDPYTGAIATGIAQTAAFAYGTLERGASLFRGEVEGWRYSRFGNPTLAALESKLSDLEEAESAVVFASGTAATAAIVLGLLRPGDEIAFLGPLYGGTEGYFRELESRKDIVVRTVDDDKLEMALSRSTKLLWIETPSNPTLRLHDLQSIATVARKKGVLTVADNTLSTPCITQPLSHGIDIVMHSMTKYLSGHGDAIGGAVIGPKRLIDCVRKSGLSHLGSSLSPHDAFLILRGLKTLSLRMTAHCENGMQIARFLSEHRAVRRVYYPGLPCHPSHELAQRQMRSGFGGIVSFEVAPGTRSAAAAVLDSLSLFTQAVSLGDVESLACHPASTTHSFISDKARASQGIDEGLIRLSAGIEHPRDLTEDLSQALNMVASRS